MIRLVLLVFALVCFIIAAFGLSTGKINMVALGLALLTASMVFPLGGLT